MQFCLSLAEISITRLSFYLTDTNLQGKTRPEVGHQIILSYCFFPRQEQIEIKKVLNHFFRLFRGL